MTTQEIFDRLMELRNRQFETDEQFDATMWDVAKVLGLSREQADALAGEMPSAPVVQVVEPASVVLNPADFEITDGYVGSFGVTWEKATEESLTDAIEKAAERNNKTVAEISKLLLDGKRIAWCDSPNYYYDHGTGVIRRKHTVAPAKLTRCACGHSVPAAQVMSASMGTSCPDCYDRMSN